MYDFSKKEIEHTKRLKIANDMLDTAKDLAERGVTLAEDFQKEKNLQFELLNKIYEMSWWKRIFLPKKLIKQLMLLQIENNKNKQVWNQKKTYLTNGEKKRNLDHGTKN